MENQKQNPKDQLVERLKQANNVLVTVSRNPSVDQLSAAIGLTVMLNQLDKHATAVFSGEVPDTLEFLKPEETLEKNTDSLRDFIISLDKAKADKLRYKVEDTYVKIFITPYKTSLSEADLVFGQGDFNVDLVVALGVHEKEELDQAITNHGRILHDATVATINTNTNGQIGSINWVDAQASSLSEMLVPVCDALKSNALDAQIATAFLTGIVAETNRFSNEKTSSDTMKISAKLMAAGANQQLVATKLEQATAAPVEPEADQPQAEATNVEASNDGSLSIEHHDEPEETPTDLPDLPPEPEPAAAPEDTESSQDTEQPAETEPSRLILEPPTLGGKLTANAEPEALDPSTDPMTVKPVDQPILSHNKAEDKPEEDTEPKDILAPLDSNPDEEVKSSEPTGPVFPTPPLVPDDQPEQGGIPELAPPPELDDTPVQVPETTVGEPPEDNSELTVAPLPTEDNQTLTQLEEAIDSPHAESPMPEAELQPEQLDAEAALAAAHLAFEAAADPNATHPEETKPDGEMDISHEEVASNAPAAPPQELTIDPNTGEIRYPTNVVPAADSLPTDPTAATVNDPTAPPPVPPPMAMPPMMPPTGNPIDPDNLPPVNQ